MINEEAAYAYVEARLWPDGPICPHCGGFDKVYAMTPNAAKRIRIGLKMCGQCRKQFTVKVGTIFEQSHVPLNLWLQAMYFMCSSKKGISTQQLHRTLGVTLKTAWFMSHRIREAMREGDLAPFGGGGTPVEVDETFIGTDNTRVNKGMRRAAHMNKIVTLIDRETGRAQSIVVKDLSIPTVTKIVSENVAREARLMTDEAYHYVPVGKTFAEHGTTNHKAEIYVSREDPTIHSNTVEGYFSIFKRGMKGVYQHCKSQHLHRYMAEFDFRYSNRIALGVDDVERTDQAIRGTSGKRLTYRTTSGQAGTEREARA
jgi:transposase-like protein